MSLDPTAINKFVVDWYVSLDRHEPLAYVKEYLLDDGLEMVFPETTARGHAGFAEWYQAVTNRFFDEKHVVTKVDSDIQGDEARLTVVVNWQAKIWNPPEPNSQWLGFDADQTWVVVPGDNAMGVKIKTYIVNSLAPMPGSASL